MARTKSPLQARRTILEVDGKAAVNPLVRKQNEVEPPPNNPPQISPPSDQTGHPGILISFPVYAYDPDGDSLTYSLINAPSGATIDSTGTFHWTPTWSQLGAYLITIKVTDPQGDSAQAPCTVSVTNDPPQLYSPGDQQGHPGQQLMFTLSASDPQGDPLTFSIVSGPSGATIDPTSGTFSWTPSAGDLGNHFVTFRVTDPGDSQADVTTLIRVENAPPQISVPSSQTAHPESEISFSVMAFDPDGDSLTFSLSGPSAATIDSSSGYFRWTPAWSELGLHLVTIRVTDEYGAYAEAPCMIEVVNQPPQISPPGDQYVYAGDSLSFQVYAMDPDGDSLTYELINPPYGATIDSSSGQFTWTTAAGDEGAYFVTVKVKDPGDASDAAPFLITVVSRPGGP